MRFEAKVWWAHEGCFKAFLWVLQKTGGWKCIWPTKLSCSLYVKVGAKDPYMIDKYSFIGIYFQKLRKVWNRKIVTYSILEVIKTLFINQIKPIQLDGEVVYCVLNGYPIGGKCYELLGVELGGSKFINHRYITFSESHKGRSRKDIGMKTLETMVENTRFEVETHILDNISSERIIT